MILLEFSQPVLSPCVRVMVSGPKIIVLADEIDRRIYCGPSFLVMVKIYMHGF